MAVTACMDNNIHESNQPRALISLLTEHLFLCHVARCCRAHDRLSYGYDMMSGVYCRGCVPDHVGITPKRLTIWVGGPNGTPLSES